MKQEQEVRLKNNNKGLVIKDKNKYKNIAEITHTFHGSTTIEDAIKDMILSKLREDKIIN
ncbi:hypothetical protein [Alkaliphilus sp. B6464]|uniref:hypothetical protein n=1 Tax=Alkaliphilus sp. B6464 TaxID=2731219 RepID=UPI001BAC24D0|nr:hypothetical protein [Alkaliphilus sp. B6464]QUH20421.1 hypothetical protein HYG84_11280 [Alkaliphilus sp. B6464]